MIRAWIQATRPLAHANIVTPLLIGQAAAYAATGVFHWQWLAVAHILGVLDHLVIIFWNDYADVEADKLNESPTAFSGGSRVIVDGKLSRAAIQRAGIGATVAMFGVSGVAAAFGRPATVVFAIAGLVLVQLYSFGPARLSYRGHGEALQALGLGVVLPGLGYYLQSGELASIPWELVLATTLYGYAGNVLTALPDVEGDRRADKRTLAVRFGSQTARAVFIAVLLAAVSVATTTASDLPTAATIAALPVACALLLIGLVGSAGPDRRGRMLTFVVIGGLAIQGGLIAWTVVLLQSR